jgi:DNA/RNA endonuclease YhcR with UshA esterase domain
MKRFLSLSVIACATLSLSAADTTTNTVAKIGAADAAKHFDETLVVTGQVAEVTVLPRITFINLDQPHPNSPFTCVIFPAATNQFPGIKSLKGKSIEVSGRIKNYHDKPEIVLDTSNQLTVVTPAK